MIISSRQNSHFKHLCQLNTDSAYRREKSLFVAEGIHLAIEAWQSNAPVRQVICSEEFFAGKVAQEILPKFTLKNVEVVELKHSCYAAFSNLHSPEGIAVIVCLEEMQLIQMIKPTARIVVLAGIQNPGNAGAIVRTAEAAGFTGIVFSEGSVDLTHPVMLRAAMGSNFRLQFARGETREVVGSLQDKDFQILAIEANGTTSFTKADYKEPIAVILGNEGHGIPDAFRKAASQTVYIPMSGRTESLNTAVAAALLLYEVRKTWV